MAQRARELQSLRPNRIPPHNLDAEQSVLGAMLESKEAIANVLEIVSAQDFYKPAHGDVYEATLAVYGRGEAVDAITVSDELERRGVLAQIGGKAYILGLLEAYPTASSAAYYAKIVEEHSLLRQLVNAGNKVQEIGFSMPDDVDDAIDEAEELVYEVGNRRLRDDMQPIRSLLTENMEQIEALYERGEHITGTPSGFDDLDEMTAGFQPNNLIIVAARPSMGKSSLLNDFTLHAALKRKERSPVVIFSLEMSRHEVVKRFLSSEARVDSQRISRGTLQEQDWGKLSNALGRLAQAPIFIDDAAHITLMEIRAKCRRIKAKQGLGLVIVDYLQLMQSPRRSENRQQEVSEISRGLKILARELEVPVICASQLNRGVEMRGDKRPLLGDLRESGCLTADTLITRADNGAQVSLGSLLEAKATDIPVWSLDASLRLVPATMTHVFASSVKRVYRLRLRSGREVKATANHPFLSVDGWRPLSQLRPGDKLAVPRKIPSPCATVAWPDDQIVLLAHLIGDGCFVERQPLHYTSQDPRNLDAVESAAASFGVKGRRVRQQTWWHLYLPAPYKLARGRRNPIVAWLSGLGIYGKRSREKFVPSSVFGLPNAQITLFLRHLWATDGHVSQRSNGQVSLYYGSGSRRLIEDVRSLLLRLDIRSRVARQTKVGYEPCFALHITGARDQSRFLRRVGVHGARGDGCAAIADHLDRVIGNTNLDTIPRSVWSLAKTRMATSGITARQLAPGLGTAYCGSTLDRHAPSRQHLKRVAEILSDDDLRMLATSDVFWDEIGNIEPLGEEPVFDATVLETHNFIADGIVAHNSIEQDADVVMFLYRDEVYNKDTEARGEAELIVAKHRNGPTGTVNLAFMNQYTKFASLAKGMR